MFVCIWRAFLSSFALLPSLFFCFCLRLAHFSFILNETTSDKIVMNDWQSNEFHVRYIHPGCAFPLSPSFVVADEVKLIKIITCMKSVSIPIVCLFSFTRYVCYQFAYTFHGDWSLVICSIKKNTKTWDFIVFFVVLAIYIRLRHQDKQSDCDYNLGYSNLKCVVQGASSAICW